MERLQPIASTGPTLHRPSPLERNAIPHAVVGVLIFIFTELMFFSALLAAYFISAASATTGWPPLGQPRLPVGATAINTVALLASGVLLWRAGQHFGRDGRRSLKLMLAALALGTFFVVAQGVEWVGLIREGLTLTTSRHGSFFYLIIGAHALHAVGAILALGWIVLRARKNILERSTLEGMQFFWYFVVGVWPVLYWAVYL